MDPTEEKATFLMIVLIAVIVVLGPPLIIWALNTLFYLNIPLTLATWAAILILGGTICILGR